MNARKIALKNKCYVWSGKNLQGKIITGEIFAYSRNLAKLHLKQQSITPVTVRKKINIDFKKLNHKISTQDITLFFRQLATLIASGIPIVQACDILKYHAQKKLHSLIHALKSEMEAGRGLASGLRKHPRHFDNMACQLVQAGEETGTLDIMLKRITLYQEKKIALKNKIKQALLYPSIIVIVSISVAITMLTFVVPRFAELFQNMHGKLPAFTSAIISFSDLLHKSIRFIFIPLIATLLCAYYFKKSAQFRNRLHRFCLKIPAIGMMIKKNNLAKLARSLAVILTAGIPIIEALKLIAPLSNNPIIVSAITQLQSEIAKGQQLHLAMQINPLFPAMMVQMIKVGEESGTLDQMLEKVADFYEADLDNYAARLSHLLEPLIIIILGALIGGLVIGMYLPIFKLGTVI